MKRSSIVKMATVSLLYAVQLTWQKRNAASLRVLKCSFFEILSIIHSLPLLHHFSCKKDSNVVITELVLYIFDAAVKDKQRQILATVKLVLQFRIKR